jgi:integrase/recombinase XerD
VFLADAGYTPLSAANQMRVLAHLSRWLAERELAPGALTAERAEEFAACRRELGRVHWTSERGLRPVLGYLRGAGVIPGPAVPAVVSALDELLERYRRYLVSERGLAASTIRGYTARARLFLTGREESLPVLTAAEVSGFVLAHCPAMSTGSAKMLVTVLRSVLRFLAAEGLAPPGLAAAVPAVAGRRDGGLPKALPPGQVTALLASCGRTATGLRDLAVLTLLARLGLRAGEVTALELDDISWRAGEITIRGKGRRDERLPLPADAGQALAAYLHGARPAVAGVRAVFLSARAPARALSCSAVNSVVRLACARAGLPLAGPHRLRHSAAAALLAGGAPLAEVGQVLRHRSEQTTAIYAKVDQGALAALMVAWPGDAA